MEIYEPFMDIHVKKANTDDHELTINYHECFLLKRKQPPQKQEWLHM